jgi:hypothetical protein
MGTLWNIFQRRERREYNLGENYGEFITDKKRKNVEFP